MKSITEQLLRPDGKVNISYVKGFLKAASEEEKRWYYSSPGETLSEKAYLLTHSKGACLFCGADTKFISYKEGYRDYCSNSCRSKGTSDKAKKTCLEKYGVERPAQSPAIQAKMKQTSLARHGVENIFQNKEYIAQKTKEALTEERKKEIRIKTEETNKRKYGGVAPLQNKEIAQKVKDTNLQKYGSTCSLHNNSVQKKAQKTKRKKFWNRLLKSSRLQTVIPLFEKEEYLNTTDEQGQVVYYPWLCKTCKTEFEDYLANGRVPRCPTCFPPQVQGRLEKELSDWLSELLPQEEILFNTRRVIAPLELDIYLPNRNLAIEFNEVYWHSEVSGRRGRDYHLNKTQRCKEKGIFLLHIWDFEWYEKKEIVQSIIKAKLNIFSEKLGARTCAVRDLSPVEARTFFEENHIQGSAEASIRKGLIDRSGRIVSVLSLGRNRFKNNTYEVVRFANLKNMTVHGGYTKLFKKAIENLPLSFTILSYADLRLFEGESCQAAGFTLSHSNPPGLHYTKDYKALESRLKYQKHKLPELLELYNPELTEWENLQLNKFDRVWDCGTKVYSLEGSQ